MFTLILNFVICMLAAYHVVVHVLVNLFSHSSEPKPSLHHIDCSQNTLTTSEDLNDLEY